MEVILKETLTTILTAIISLLGAYAVFYINKAKQKIDVETEQIKDEKQKKLVNDAIDRIQALTISAVNATQETTVKELKLAIANGTKDRAELVALSGKVATDIYGQLTPSVLELAQTEIVDVKSYILDLIENQVTALKVE